MLKSVDGYDGNVDKEHYPWPEHLMADLEEKIAVHEKARGETIHVYIGEYNGKKYLHIREWYVDKDQEEKPTKKGVAIPIEKVQTLKEAIDKLLPK